MMCGVCEVMLGVCEVMYGVCEVICCLRDNYFYK